MVLKLILRYQIKREPFSRLFQIASVEYKYDINLLRETVLNRIGASLKKISEGGKFNISLDDQNKNSLSWSGEEDDVNANARESLCDAEIRLFVVGDLKFYAQMLGRDNMSGSWCMWCRMAPTQWNKEDGIPLQDEEEWTIETLKAPKVLLSEGRLKKPIEIRGVVDFPLWDFIPVSHYIYPVLHGEIGLVNNALDAFYDILDDNIEVLTDEEKMSRNTTILSDAAFEAATENLTTFKESLKADITFYDIMKSDINDRLQEAISQEERDELYQQMQEIRLTVSQKKAEQKELEADVKAKRAQYFSAKKAFKELRLKKTKGDRPVRAEVQDILENFEISAAAYHGGDLNGVCARRLLANAKPIFESIQAYLLEYDNAEKCSDDTIFQICDLYSSIFATLDVITAKLRIKSGNATMEDHGTLLRSLSLLKKLWDSADLSYTPKVHSLLIHAPKQMQRFNGIGDLLEDDVEKMHQIAGSFESRVARLKSATNRALAQAKMEAITHNNAVRKCLEQSQNQSKRKLDDTKPSYKKENIKVQKTERNQMRLETLKGIEDNPPPKLITAYEKLKEEVKKSDSN